MFKNHIKIAYRSLLKSRLFTIINILGLSIGISACLLIFQFVSYELSYEKSIKNYDRMFRINTSSFSEGKLTSHTALSSYKFVDAIESYFPQVEKATQLLSTRNWFDCTLQYEDNGHVIVFNEPNLFFADSSFLNFFALSLESGDFNTALNEPYSIILSKSAAERYFKEENPVGKLMRLKGSMEDHFYNVTGVMDDIPKNSHLGEIDIIASLASVKNIPFLNVSDLYNYILLKEHSHPSDLQTGFQNIMNNNVLTQSDFSNDGSIFYEAQPIKDIYLYSRLEDEIHAGGNPDAIYMLLIIALSILIIAWINYVNLSTSRSMERSKEVAVRKVSGASRTQLIRQFLTESFIVNVSGILLALVLVKICSVVLYQIIGLSNYQDIFRMDGFTILIIVFIFIIGIFLSGLYPAKMISGGNPMIALKGKFTNNRNDLNLRKGLVVFQFGCCVGLMISVFVIYFQFKHMQDQDLKINIENTLVVKAPANLDSTYLYHLQNFKANLKSMSYVNSVTTSSAVPGDFIDWWGNVRTEKEKDASHNQFTIVVVDGDFFDSYDLEILAGRNFEESEFPGEKFGQKIESVVINELGTRLLNFTDPEDAVGSIVHWGPNKCKVIGVVNNFHQKYLKNPLEPMLFTLNVGPIISLKLNNIDFSENTHSSLKAIVESWDVFFPNNPFDYFFLEDHYQAQYNKDLQFVRFFYLLCGLAAIVSSIGLLGLSSFSTKRRIKEVGLRKVLGASISNVTMLLTFEFLKLVVIASLIAAPITYFGINIWLDNYAFRIDLSGWMFIIPIILVLLIAFLTVGFQTLAVARTNPVNTLKCE